MFEDFRAFMSNNQFKFSDEEIIQLAELNPGYGFRRFIKSLYPNTHKFSQYKYEFTLLFNDFKEFCGIDLIEILDDPKFSIIVSGDEYLRITGEKQLPVGYGRSLGGRSSKPETVKTRGAHIKIPLPPQDFNWENIPNEQSRKRS